MPTKYSLAEETLGYTTSPDPSNTDKRFLVDGSKNVLVDYQKKVKIRPGYFRVGVANSDLTEIRNAWTWNTSTGQERAQRFYDDELEVWLGTVDTVEINAWKRVANSLSTTKKLRATTWFDTTENIDLQIMVQGDANLYEWGGGVAVALSVSSLNITEAGDASNQMSAWSIAGMTTANTNAGVLYWKLTDSAGDRTVKLYKDSAGLNEVATGTRTGDGVVTLTESNSSGITGSVTVAYSGDDTTVSDNTLTLGYTLTKAGTTTFAQNRFYATRNKLFINLTSGKEYQYTGGESTTALTGVIPATGAVDLAANDILVQKIVTVSNKPASSHTNDVIYSFENQIVVGSYADEEIYISKNNDYDDFSFSSPRVPGEGALLTLSDPVRAIASLGSVLLLFSGRSSIFKCEFNQITVGSTLAETLKIKKLDVGIDQGALNQESVVPLGNALAYLTNEVALRIIESPDNLVGINPKTFSNPIKPDFDAEDWDDNAFGYWYKNILFFTIDSHMYMLNFVQDADGKLFRFWNPPQIWPVGPMSIFDTGNGSVLHGHSDSVPETYELFYGQSDGQYADMDVANKLPIDAVARFAYNGYKNRALLKNFDEYYVEGEITPNTTDLVMGLNYDVGGSTQAIERTIDGSDLDILEGPIDFNSLGQQSLALNPLGGLLNPPTDSIKFRVVFEIAKEDFHQIQAIFSTNDVDLYWAITAHGANAQLSTRKNTRIRK